MKTTFALLMATLLSVASVYAGGACCSKVEKDGQISYTFASLNLSADQESKLKALEADCAKAGCTEESMNKFTSEAKEILTPEQFAQFKAACDKNAQKKS